MISTTDQIRGIVGALQAYLELRNMRLSPDGKTLVHGIPEQLFVEQIRESAKALQDAIDYFDANRPTRPTLKKITIGRPRR